MESFYWLLIWLLLRHANHAKGPFACTQLFDREEYAVAASVKRTWLQTSTLEIEGNEPLTILLEKLRSLFEGHVVTKSKPSVDVSHTAFLNAVDAAISMDTWPEEDDASPFQLPSLTQVAKSAGHASNSKWKVDAEGERASSGRASGSKSQCRPDGEPSSKRRKR
jgi:hypothetical protein